MQAPFGGWKMSGFGRELGPEGIQGFSQQRHIRLKRAFS
ncbi:MAG: aldehyde dehydrogenase family protein [Paeniglutamicibacter sp.]